MICSAQASSDNTLSPSDDPAGDAVDATPQEAWAVLTDFDGMEKFVSNLKTSEVLSRQGNVVRVHTKGHASFGPIQFPFEAVRELTLTPYERIQSKQVSGTLKRFEGETRITPTAQGTRVTYRGDSTSNQSIPFIVGPSFIKSETEEQFHEMQTEILRRRMETGRKIMNLRLDLGITQRDMAARCRISPGSLSKIETGTNRPSSAALRTIARVLGTSADYLLDEALTASDPVRFEAVAGSVADQLGRPYTDFPFELGKLPPTSARSKSGRKNQYQMGGTTAVTLGGGGVGLACETVNGDITIRERS